MRAGLLIIAVFAASGCGAADPTEDLPPAYSPGSAKDVRHMVQTALVEARATSSSSGTGFEQPAVGLPDDNCAPWKPNPTTQPAHAFSGTPPFEIRDVTLRANEMHGAPVAGKDCLGCHNGKSKAPSFDFAGSIYTSVTGSTPAAGTEVRVVRPDGLFVSVRADEDGNFWHKGPTPAPRGSMTGVRNQSSMFVGHLNGPACNSCHTPGNRLYIR